MNYDPELYDHRITVTLTVYAKGPSDIDAIRTVSYMETPDGWLEDLEVRTKRVSWCASSEPIGLFEIESVESFTPTPKEESKDADAGNS